MGIWFDTGLKVGRTKKARTVLALTRAQEEEFLLKGWRAVGKKTRLNKKRPAKAGAKINKGGRIKNNE